jgi:hypothetical protein
MNASLKSVLIRVNFKSRFDSLFEKHSHRNLLKTASPSEVQRIIEKLGYVCTYHENGKFFKIDKELDQISLNISTDLGIVEFILDTIIDGEGTGGPFGYLATLIDSTDERIRKPRFSNYAELEEILAEGFSIYEDIKKGLLLENQS